MISLNLLILTYGYNILIELDLVENFKRYCINKEKQLYFYTFRMTNHSEKISTLYDEYHNVFVEYYTGLEYMDITEVNKNIDNLLKEKDPILWEKLKLIKC